jgi:phenylpyruvate tautomerase PptA (4-oxalocrotonate tautomerase family)
LPLITLSLEAGRTRAQKRQLADAVYEAPRAGIQIPENDRFVAIREHAAGDLIADPGYLGVARSEHPVFVEITLRRGRPTEKKPALYTVFTNTMSGQQPRGAAFRDRKAASGSVPAAMPFAKTVHREIARRMSATGLVRAEDILIVLRENETPDWSFGNGVAQYVEAEQRQGRE